MHKLSCGSEFDFEDNGASRKTHFHKKLLGQDCFETEGKGNTEIAYWVQTPLLLCNNHCYVPYWLHFYFSTIKCLNCLFVRSFVIFACLPVLLCGQRWEGWRTFVKEMGGGGVNSKITLNRSDKSLIIHITKKTQID